MKTYRALTSTIREGAKQLLKKRQILRDYKEKIHTCKRELAEMAHNIYPSQMTNIENVNF
jgi:hypothetical protein